jgi:gliding motility-associated lipoprotein GldD
MKQIIVYLILLIFIAGCKEKYTPKPHGFYRIDFPEKKYHPLNKSNFPYQFEIPNYSKIILDSRNLDQPYWINIFVPENRAEIHISYFDLKNSKQNKRTILAKLMEESRRLAYKHSIKADAIEEQIYINRAKNVYGTIYRIKGNAASPFQFFLTDSTTNFLRGAFYINEVPNIDSLKPVIDFFEPDIVRIIETTNWK